MIIEIEDDYDFHQLTPNLEQITSSLNAFAYNYQEKYDGKTFEWDLRAEERMY